MEYYYFDYLYKEIGLKAEDIDAVPAMDSADDVCDEIASKDYIIEQFADVWIAALDIKEQRVLT